LDPALLARLEAMATDYGMPAATFAAFAVADFMERQKANRAALRLGVIEAARRAELKLSDDQLERLFAPMLSALVKELAPDSALLIDQEAPKGAQ